MEIKRKEWETFKEEQKRKWLKEVDLDDVGVRQARRDTKKVLPELLKSETHWAHEEAQNCYRGMLAEAWMDMMLFNLKVQGVYHSPPEMMRYDFKVTDLGTLEVKSSPLMEDRIKIKKGAWQSEPCLYLIALKTCSKEKEPFELKIEETEYILYDMRTFKLLGYLLGQEVYQLKVEDTGWTPHYIAEKSDLRNPEELLDMLLECSEMRPKEIPKIHWKIEIHQII